MSPITKKHKGIIFFSSSIFVYLFCSLLAIKVSAQTIANYKHIGSPASESFASLFMVNDEGGIISGTFSDTFTYDGNTYISNGGDDIFVATINGNEEAVLFVAGSNYNDEITAITMDPHYCEDIYITGNFWEEITIHDSLLLSNGTSKASFLLHYDFDGDLTWTTTITGTGEKAITDIAATVETLTAVGYFSDTLFIGDTVLVAHSERDFFVAQWQQQGDFIAATHYGNTGITTASEVELMNSGKIIVGGIYNDTLTVDTTTITANTYDKDVFVACFSPTLEPLWLQKIGGVYDKKLGAMKVTPHDEIILSGGFIGVIVADDQQIQSSNGWGDTYIAKLDSLNTITYLDVLSGPLIVESLDITANEKYWGISGFFEDNINIGETSLHTTAPISGFVAFYGYDNQLAKAWKCATDDFFYPTQVNFIPGENEVVVAANFSGTMNIGEEQMVCQGAQDICLLLYDENVLTSLSHQQEATINIRLFPNPVSDLLHIDSPWNNPSISILSAHGEILQSCTNCHEISIAQLAKGVYWARVNKGNQYVVKEFVVE